MISSRSRKGAAGDYIVDYYPFEIMETTFVSKSVGDISKDKVKSTSLSAQVRRDAGQGYYSIPILIEWDGGEDIDYVNIWDIHRYLGGYGGGYGGGRCLFCNWRKSVYSQGNLS